MSKKMMRMNVVHVCGIIIAIKYLTSAVNLLKNNRTNVNEFTGYNEILTD